MMATVVPTANISYLLTANGLTLHLARMQSLNLTTTL